MQNQSADKNLARRLERIEAAAHISTIEASQNMISGYDGEWLELYSTFLLYDNRNSPLNRCFGLGLFDPITMEEMIKLERFYRKRDTSINLEVSSLVDDALLPLLTELEYVPVYHTNIFYCYLDHQVKSETIPQSVYKARTIDEQEGDIWSDTFSKGFEGANEKLNSFIQSYGNIATRSLGHKCFIVREQGRAIASGSLFIKDGVAFIMNSSTLTSDRSSGAHLALHSARLEYAKIHGCDLAMICTIPGSVSQRNAERFGFNLAYTRMRWSVP